MLLIKAPLNFERANVKASFLKKKVSPRHTVGPVTPALCSQGGMDRQQLAQSQCGERLCFDHIWGCCGRLLEAWPPVSALNRWGTSRQHPAARWGQLEQSNTYFHGSLQSSDTGSSNTSKRLPLIANEAAKRIWKVARFSEKKLLKEYLLGGGAYGGKAFKPSGVEWSRAE